jgi:Nickel responsive protein SCO4226-like
MPKYVIERKMPGVGKLGPAELQVASAKSCDVLQGLGPQIQWMQSYVTEDKIYCVYYAPNENLIREHAARSGFPANSISAVRAVIDPQTAEA